MGFSFFSLHFGENHTIISDGQLREKYLLFVYVICTVVLLRTSSTTQLLAEQCVLIFLFIFFRN